MFRKSMELKLYKDAKSIPNIWDEIAKDNYFIQRESLSVLEKCNPCDITYFMINDESIFVTYKLNLNLLTYSKFNLKKKITIIGIPLSIGSSGFIAKNNEHLKYILNYLKGFILILNTDNPIDGLAYGYTLPDIKMEVPINEKEYISSLKSNYKKRINIIKNDPYIITEIKKENFSQDLYKKYEEVFNKSEYKLEKQNIEYFKKYDAQIFTFSKNNLCHGFIQIKEINNKMYFILGGFDYKENTNSKLYLSMLYKVITEGIGRGCEYIVLGQTAEEAKLRFGGKLVNKYMNIYCKNKFLLFLIKRIIKVFQYKNNTSIHKVFKEKNGG